MRLIGIDYGLKRVGIAVADTDLKMAFPKSVLKNDEAIFATIKKIVSDEGALKIILGESKDLSGKDNAISEDIKVFKQKLEDTISLPVIYEPEFYTSAQAARIQGEGDMIDASAATIILQSYIDKHIKT